MARYFFSSSYRDNRPTATTPQGKHLPPEPTGPTRLPAFSGLTPRLMGPPPHLATRNRLRKFPQAAQPGGLNYSSPTNNSVGHKPRQAHSGPRHAPHIPLGQEHTKRTRGSERGPGKLRHRSRGIEPQAPPRPSNHQRTGHSLRTSHQTAPGDLTPQHLHAGPNTTHKARPLNQTTRASLGSPDNFKARNPPQPTPGDIRKPTRPKADASNPARTSH